jgi:hypothetical protein
MEIDLDYVFSGRELTLDKAFRTEFGYQFTPRTFRGRNLPVEISIGEGWWPLVHDMCEEIHEKIKHLDNRKVLVQWLQIKEKFGILRAYSNFSSQMLPSIYIELDGIIQKYENESSRICEICGKPGSLRTGSWLKTLCDEHHAKREEENRRMYGLKTDV